MQTRERAHCARSVFPFIKKKKKKLVFWRAKSTVLIKYSGKYIEIYFNLKITFFALQALLPLRRCPFFMSDFFGSHAPRVVPSSLSLPSEGRDGGGRSRDALVLLPEGFPLLPLDLIQREGWRSLCSRVRCTRARFCQLGSFVD